MNNENSENSTNHIINYIINHNSDESDFTTINLYSNSSENNLENKVIENEVIENQVIINDNKLKRILLKIIIASLIISPALIMIIVYYFWIQKN